MRLICLPRQTRLGEHRASGARACTYAPSPVVPSVVHTTRVSASVACLRGSELCIILPLFSGIPGSDRFVSLCRTFLGQHTLHGLPDLLWRVVRVSGQAWHVVLLPYSPDSAFLRASSVCAGMCEGCMPHDLVWRRRMPCSPGACDTSLFVLYRIKHSRMWRHTLLPYCLVLAPR